MKTITESSGRMHNPAHPGEILKTMYMDPLDVNVTQVADALGVSRKHVSAIINGRAQISPDMAFRLAGVFGTDPEIWLNLQSQYDLWNVRRKPPKVEPIQALLELHRAQRDALMNAARGPREFIHDGERRAAPLEGIVKRARGENRSAVRLKRSLQR
jgi:addiction module HigA family antidote